MTDITRNKNRSSGVEYLKFSEVKMKTNLVTVVLLLWCLVYCVLGKMSGNIQTIPKRKIQTSQKVLHHTTLPMCADTCVLETDCRSVSYARVTRRCELYLVNSTTAGSDLIERNGVMLMDIENWSAASTGACRNKPCGIQTVCLPYQQSYSCTGSLVGCVLDLPPHAFAVYPDNTPRQPVGKTIGMGCHWPYITKYILGWKYLSKTCQRDGRWTFPEYACYKVEEFCTFFHFANIENSGLVLIVVSSVSHNQSEYLLSSTQGWAAETDDDQQSMTITLNTTYWIAGVATKGGVNNEWVESYKVAYTGAPCDGYTYVLNQSDEKTKIFPGNTDADTVVDNVFDSPIIAKCIRIEPITFHGGVAMRIDLRGCNSRRWLD